MLKTMQQELTLIGDATHPHPAPQMDVVLVLPE
jgi:hypothetical protein